MTAEKCPSEQRDSRKASSGARRRVFDSLPDDEGQQFQGVLGKRVQMGEDEELLGRQQAGRQIDGRQVQQIIAAGGQDPAQLDQCFQSRPSLAVFVLAVSLPCEVQIRGDKALGDLFLLTQFLKAFGNKHDGSFQKIANGPVLFG